MTLEKWTTVLDSVGLGITKSGFDLPRRRNELFLRHEVMCQRLKVLGRPDGSQAK